MSKLTIKSVRVGNHKTYYEFKERDYIVSYNKIDQDLICTCKNGSLFGVNQIQICIHKVKAMVESNIETENIKKIQDYENYWITSSGKIWSKRSDKFLKPCVGGRGYKVVVLTNKEGGKTKTLHRLIAKSFIPNPENKPEVDHKDRNRINNKLENLRWVTGLENQRYSYQNGREHNKPSKDKFGELHWGSKKVYQFDLEGNLINTYSAVMDVSRKTGFDFSPIAAVCRNKRKKFKGYLWSYTKSVEHFFRKCKVCDSLFLINREGHIYCSKSCTKKDWRKKY